MSNSQQNNQQPKKGKKKGKKQPFDVNQYPLASFVEQRTKLWDELYAASIEANKEKEKPIKVTLPDGTEKEAVAFKTTPMDIALSISKGLASSSLVAKVNGELRDMTRPLETDCSLELVKWDSEEAQMVFWHSSAHILGEALERRYQAFLTKGPALEGGGFFYDVALPPSSETGVQEGDKESIENLANYLVRQKSPFQRLVVSKENAKKMFAYNKYKMEIIDQKVPDGGVCTTYRCGSFLDLCKGPHIPNTANVKGFMLAKTYNLQTQSWSWNSSSFWRADVKNDMLQRVYGMSFPVAKLLNQWQARMMEAAKRDHRIIGKQQELFMTHELTPGSPFYFPKGVRILNKLVGFMRSQYRLRGFNEVMTPIMYNKKLWETSGHWQNYSENLFHFPCDDTTYGLKPMNCPAHCLMYNNRKRSHKDLPWRVADFGVLHRNEFRGALTGLLRCRKFQQDDAHIFCTDDQIGDEIRGCLDFLKHVYTVFGFKFFLELSTRPEKKLGDDALWDRAETILQKELEDFGFPWKINKGDGAFYGPKIDIHLLDALERTHQCATVQLDYNLPQRFDLQYVKEDNSIGRPVMIHRAILGSLERFFAVLIEHCGGKWPFWVSPNQVRIIPVGNNHEEYAKSVKEKLWEVGYDVEVDDSDLWLKKKIRNAQLEQWNYILVIGDEEVQNKTVRVRRRDDNKDLGEMSMEELLSLFDQQMKEHK